MALPSPGLRSPVPVPVLVLVLVSALAACSGSSNASSGTGSGDAGAPDGAAMAGEGAAPDAGTPGASPCTGPFVKSPVVELPMSSNGALPELTWSGGTFAAVWNGNVSDPSTATASYPLLFAIIDPASSTVRSTTTLSPTAYHPVIAAVSGGYQVVSSQSPGSMLFAQELGPTGTPVGSPQDVFGDSNGVMAASMVAGGARALVVWSGLDVIGHRVVAHDETAQPPGAAGDGIGAPSNVVWNGESFAVAWRDHPYSTIPGDGSIAAVHLLEIGVDGSSGSYSEIWHDATTNSYPGDTPSLAWTGTEYRLAWTYNGNQLLTARRARDGSGPAPAITSFDATTLRSGAPLWDGEGYGAMVAAAGGTVLARFSADGAARAAPLLVDASDLRVNLVHTGREYAGSWVSGERASFARFGGCP